MAPEPPGAAGDQGVGPFELVDPHSEEIERLTARLAATQRALAERDDRIRELTAEIGTLHGLHGGTALAFAGAARRTVIRLLPARTRRARAVGYVLGAVQGVRHGQPGPAVPPAPKSEATRYRADPAVVAAEYRTWRGANEPGPDELERLRGINATWSPRPLVSVILPVADGPAAGLGDSIESVVAQVYDAWELVIVADDRRPEVAASLARWADGDTRIHVVTERPGGGSAPVQVGADQAGGEWVVRLAPGDQLRPDALHRLVAHVRDHAEDDVVYGDEDRLDGSGVRSDPEFKPDWSPAYLLSRDYLGRSTAIRRSLLAAVGGWHEGAPDVEDHDLHLRATERARGVGHVPAVVSTRRNGGADVGGSLDERPDNPVDRALERRGRPGRATARAGGWYDVRYPLDGQPSVDIIIPTRDRVELLSACVDSVTEWTTYPNYRITVVDNDSVEDATLRYLKRPDLHVVPGPGPFNFSRLVNAGVRASTADYVVLLNNDVTVITPDWIEAMLELGQQPDVGAVGCRLLFPDGSVQHEGVALIREYIAANTSWPWPVVRDASAVTAACMLVRRDVYWSVDGFDEDMGVVYNDVDFCLRLLRSGKRVLYTPYAELEHDESSSRGGDNPPADIDLFFARWGTPDRLTDPFVSPHVVWPHPQRLRVT